MSVTNKKIAVVGVSCIFPESLNCQDFWHNIIKGKDFIAEVPPSYWLSQDYYDPATKEALKTYCKRGSFLTEVLFDPLEFGMPPNIVYATDTVQLLALLAARNVLRDTLSIQTNKVSRKNTSVVLGVAGGTEQMGDMSAKLQEPIWIKALREEGVAESKVREICRRITASYPEWNENTFPGLLSNVVAGRIANRLDLGGMNCVADAACASSLSAINYAIDELLLGHTELVISGGADAINNIFMYMCFTKTPALSLSGDCRPFSAQADGTILGEGVAMLGLRRLEDAERDGDKIYGVISAVGTSSDGKAKSIYAPSSSGQALAMERAYSKLTHTVTGIELVEAHGTATVAGDLAEFNGLKQAFGETPQHQFCALGSIKAQIGHTKSAAGAAGIFKTVMALNNKTLPPTIKVTEPNPKLEISNSPFYLNTASRPWIHEPSSPRRAAVNSSGFGGSNFHMVLEEYRGTNRAKRFYNQETELLLVAADTVAALADNVNRLLAQLEKKTVGTVAKESQLNYQSTAALKLALLVSDSKGINSFCATLLKKIKANPTENFSLPNQAHYVNRATQGKLAFIFAGQGSQYVNMGAQLAMQFDAALQVWDKSADLDFAAEKKLSQVVFPIPEFSSAAQEQQFLELTQTEWAQPGIGAVCLSQLALLDKLGIKADCVAGHSYGEVVALYVSGVIQTAEELLLISRKRGELMAQAANEPGAMSAIFVGAEQVEAYLKKLQSRVTIANINSPNQTVVAGRVADIQQLEEELTASEIKFKRLPVPTAFHSSLVSSSATACHEYLNQFTFKAPNLPVYSNTTGQLYGNNVAEITKMLARQLATPVLFKEEIEAMYAAGVRVFVEVGPGNILKRLVTECLEEQEHLAVSLDGGKNQSGLTSFWNALGVLAVHGIEMQWQKLWEEFAEFAEKIDPSSYSKATVKLRGHNYGKPYPPKEGVAGIPQPNPEPSVQQPVASAESTKISTPDSSYHQERENQVNSAPLATKAAPDQQLLQVLTAIQNNITAGYKAFLHSSEVALQHLEGKFNNTASTTNLSLGASEQKIVEKKAQEEAPHIVKPTTTYPDNDSLFKMQAASNITAESQPPVNQEVKVVSSAKAKDFKPLLLQIVAEKTGYPIEMLELDLNLESGLGIDSIKRVEILSTLQERVPELKNIDAGKLTALNTLREILEFVNNMEGAPEETLPAQGAAAPKAAAVDYQALLLEIVAEKTGYPVEMLELDLNLESGLGIDSIKRVEILSTLQERVPELKNIDAGKLTALNTLREILEFVSNMEGAPEETPPAQGAAAPKAAAVDYQALLLEIVAEKTGYPVEMLELDLNLESGLGIDSIKRVEILSTLQERVPELKNIDAGKLTALNTLREILEFVSNREGIPGGAPPAQEAVAPNAAPAVDYQGLLLEIVAEKTGYPVEMLELDLNLESGLGIDSIKRVEILSTLQERVPELKNIDAGKLTALNTLGEILEFTQQGDTKISAQANSTTSEPVTTSTSQVVRYAVEEYLAPASGVTLPGLTTGTEIHIIQDNRGVAEVLQKKLEQIDIASKVVSEPEAESKAVISLRGLAELDPNDPLTAATTLNKQLFQIAQKFGRILNNNSGVFVTVADSRSTNRAWVGGSQALAKTAALEWPKVKVKSLDIACAQQDAATIAETIFTELIFGGPELEVILTPKNKRLSYRTHIAAVQDTTRRLRYGDVVVVSGGARGVTAECLVALAEQVKLKMAILGRTQLIAEPEYLAPYRDEAALKKVILEHHKAAGESITPVALSKEVATIIAQRELQANLKRLEDLGTQVKYYAVDICDRAGVTAALAEVRNTWGEIHGVIHAAGVVKDRYITEKTLDQFTTVFATKVVGLQNLLFATKDDPLTHLCCFSSVAARLGNVGQVDYAMANEVLNRVCQEENLKRQGKCVVKAINWGPWEGGMVGPELKKHFIARGVTLIPLAVGAKLFVAELADANTTQVESVIGGSLADWQPQHGEVKQWELLINDRTYPFLQGHAIKGVPVVPAVLAHEWCFRLARSLYPDKQNIVATNLKVLKGIQVPELTTRGLAVIIEGKERKQNNKIILDFVIKAKEGFNYYAVTLELDDSEVALVKLDLTAQEMAPWSLAPQAIYGEKLFHSREFTVIDKLEGTATDSCSGILKYRESLAGEGSGRCANLMILDGGLQLIALWGIEDNGHDSLPIKVDYIKLYQPCIHNEPIYCYAKLSKKIPLQLTWDLFFLNQEHEVVAKMLGVVVQSGTDPNLYKA